jgi:predicted lipid-binding transport protein (Tim44 family)
VNRLAFFVLLLSIAAALFAQAPPPKKYQPTEVESLRLQVKQKDAQLASYQAQQAQQAAQKAYADLMAEADKVKEAEHWPANVQFDPSQLSFSEPPAPPTKGKP